jgi:hypothetical protein
MLDRLLRRHQKPLPATVAAPIAPKQSTTARERVRSGIEPLEGRIAPAILVNAHLLTYTDENGDLVSVKFSKDIFDLSSVAQVSASLANVFKFTEGSAHLGSANDDGRCAPTASVNRSWTGPIEERSWNTLEEPGRGRLGHNHRATTDFGGWCDG